MHCNFTSKALGEGSLRCRFVNYAKNQTFRLGIVCPNGVDSHGFLRYAEGGHAHARSRRVQLWLLSLGEETRLLC
jgi:hypothetical protein